jgi:D-alanyl-D-alanine carboxypeptidase
MPKTFIYRISPFVKRKSSLMYALAGLLLAYLIIAYGMANMDRPLTPNTLKGFLDQQAGSKVPGLQYVVLDSNQTLYEYAGGWADIANQKPMTLDTTMMAYSMTKTITAVAILQLVEQNKLGLDDGIGTYLPDIPYDSRITIRQLLAHTSGIPNPIPLRWIHLAEESSGFDEDAALAKVLQDNPELDFEPGTKYSYSNISYWLLGQVIEKVTEQPYTEYVATNILKPLRIPANEMGVVIAGPALHAKGYLAKYSMMNLAKGFVTDGKYWGSYEGNWLQIKSHLLNGPSFGGLVGTARGFSLFLRDQLQAESVLISPQTKQLLETQQANNAGEPIPMTLGWHIGEVNGVVYYFKEGGGGGFHCEMRLYPSLGIASVVMVNDTQFNSSQFLNRVDAVFFPK